MRHNLLFARKTRQFTQRKLADIIGISLRHYQLLEHGNSNGSIHVWQRLAQKLETPIDVLLAQESETLGNSNTNLSVGEGKGGV